MGSSVLSEHIYSHMNLSGDGITEVKHQYVAGCPDRDPDVGNCICVGATVEATQDILGEADAGQHGVIVFVAHWVNMRHDHQRAEVYIRWEGANGYTHYFPHLAQDFLEPSASIKLRGVKLPPVADGV